MIAKDNIRLRKYGALTQDEMACKASSKVAEVSNKSDELENKMTEVNGKSYQVTKTSKYKVNSKSTVWLCPNAKLKDHECLYALCDLCYRKLAPAKRRRRGILKQKTCVSGGVRCNHNVVLSLEQFFDKQYFTTKWKVQMIQEEGMFPQKCQDCGNEFVA